MKKTLKSDYGILIAFTALVSVVPFMLANKYYISVLIFVAINMIVAVGLNLLVCHAGQISLGHAGFYGIGAYTTAVLTTAHHCPVWVDTLIAVALAALIAWIMGTPTLKLKGHYLAVATLGLGIIMHIVFNEWEKVTGGPSGIVGIPGLSIFGRGIGSDLAYYYLFWSFALLTLLVALNLVKSRVGRAMRALHGSEVAAAAMGINVSGYKVKIFVLSAALAALAGSFYAHYVTFISPTGFGLSFSILLLTMIIVGGAESVWGAVIGSVVLTSLPEFLRGFKDYDVVIYGFILVAVVIFLPAGIIGGLRILKERIGRRGTAESA
ncbi:MAG TPA: branched-chain amino acid ABC transporter permease [bacterium]|nr:branched-chain amino acid ABC transporter permease [bacterium]